MNTNQNNIHPSFTTSVNNNNNLENIASAWPITFPLQTQIPFTSSSSSSGFLISDMVGGINLERERDEVEEEQEEEEEELGAMKEMMYRIAALQPVDIDPSTIRKPKRRNVRISDDPQSVAARHRRERISEKIRILQRLVPGGTKLDTASMLDEAIRYVKFLKKQIKLLQSPPTPPPLPQQQHCNNMGSTITTANNTTLAADWPYTSPLPTSTSAAAATGLGFKAAAGDSSRGFTLR